MQTINQMTDIHIWAVVASSLCQVRKPPRPSPEPTSEPAVPPTWMAPADDADANWDWSLPDLNPSGEWYYACIKNLEAVIRNLPNATQLCMEGLQALENHQKNFESSDGSIVHLQILWWELPLEHWEELRKGCPMNFLSEPTKGVTPNVLMTEEQVNITTKFINELWSIRVFELILDGQEMKGNAPLFTVPKPSQPEQWWYIADMKSGGQNQHIGKDPMHLPQAMHILEKLYMGGWSVVVDASKFFHNFPTHPKDHPYLGCLHPKMGQHLWYLGLPMGSSNSPALSCQYGLGMLCLLAECKPAFQGMLQENG